MTRTRPPSVALLLALTVAVATAAVGCADRQTSAAAAPAKAGGVPELPIGSACTVQFRRDVLGGAANLPVSPLANSINGATVSVGGILAKVDADWVVVERDDGTLWVPRANVLLLQFGKQ